MSTHLLQNSNGCCIPRNCVSAGFIPWVNGNWLATFWWYDLWPYGKWHVHPEQQFGMMEFNNGGDLLSSVGESWGCQRCSKAACFLQPIECIRLCWTSVSVRWGEADIPCFFVCMLACHEGNLSLTLSLKCCGDSSILQCFGCHETLMNMSDTLSLICLLNDIGTPALLCMLVKVASGPCISCIKKATNNVGLWTLSFALWGCTFEFMATLALYNCDR